MHAAPRFLFTALYVIHFRERLPPSTANRFLIRLTCALNVIENFSLLGLSLVTSQDRFEIHKTCFGAFLICSFCYMCLSYYLFTRCGFSPQNRQEVVSIKYKKGVLILYLFVIPLMLLSYYRHNEYCEPYVYSYFCIFEYTLVLANMAYHMTAYYDLQTVNVVLPSKDISSAPSNPISAGYEPLKEVRVP